MSNMSELKETMRKMDLLQEEYFRLYEKCYGCVPPPYEAEELADREEAMDNEG